MVSIVLLLVRIVVITRDALIISTAERVEAIPSINLEIISLTDRPPTRGMTIPIYRKTDAISPNHQPCCSTP